MTLFSNFSKVCGRDISETFQSLLDQLPSSQQLEDDAVAGFCGDSASIPRVFVAQYGGTPPSDFGLCSEEDMKVTPTNCTESDLRV